jgi:hypothetical protein
MQESELIIMPLNYVPLLIAIIFLAGSPLRAGAVSEGVEIRLVHLDTENADCKQQPQACIDDGGYECLSREYVYHSRKEGEDLRITREIIDYWISKNAVLDDGDFQDAKIIVPSYDPVTGQSKEMDLDAIPGRFDDSTVINDPIQFFKAQISLNESGQNKLKTVMETGARNGLAVVLDGKLLAVMAVRKQMNTGLLTVSRLTYQEAKQLKVTVSKAGHRK